jgi:hypothetical protein
MTTKKEPMPDIEIIEADRDRFQEWHDHDATLAPIDSSDKQRLIEAFACHRPRSPKSSKN